VLGGYVSAVGLALGGLVGVLIPDRVAAALATRFTSPRGRTEFRVANATFAALGAWAVAIADPGVFTAVGVLWLGAAGVRLVGLVIDRPQPDWTFWVYLGLEVGLGTAGVLGS
jgi:hypothetical protein